MSCSHLTSYFTVPLVRVCASRPSKKLLSESFSAFPVLHFTLDDMIAEGGKVASRFTMSGTHKGGFEGIPPTNRKFSIWAINIVRIVNGKFVEEWERYGTLGMMQQLDLK